MPIDGPIREPGEILKALHAINPYEGFEASRWPSDLQGWNSNHPVFEELVAQLRPRLVFEVGTWKGGSAVRMGRALQSAGIDAKLVCVDTWLGSLEFWMDQEDPERYPQLQLVNGYPSVYFQFLANVVHAGLDRIIVPFPQTSEVAAAWFAASRFQADLIYLDASHDEESVRRELILYYPLLSDRGVVFGDDHDEYWPGVGAAVYRYCRKHQLGYDLNREKWILRKDRTQIRLIDSLVDGAGAGAEVVIGEERVLLTPASSTGVALHLDLVRMEDAFVELAGWGADLSQGQPLDCILVSNGQVVISVICSYDREDIVKGTGNPGLLKCGFRAILPRCFFDDAGSAGVKVVGLTRGPSRKAVLPVQSPFLAPKLSLETPGLSKVLDANGNALPETDQFLGCIDTFSEKQGELILSGWALDPANPESLMRVAVFSGAELRLLVPVCLERKDILAAHQLKDGVLNGFHISLSIQPGSDEISLFAVGSGGRCCPLYLTPEAQRSLGKAG
jgi:cephalosporin hydroxylase